MVLPNMIKTTSYLYKSENFIAPGSINDDKVIMNYEFTTVYTYQEEIIPRLHDVQKINRL